MNNGIKNGFMFLLGGAVGAVSTYFAMKDKAAKAYTEGFQSARDAYYNEKMKEWQEHPENFDDTFNEVEHSEAEAKAEKEEKYVPTPGLPKYRPSLEEDVNNDDEFNKPYISYKEPYEITYDEFATIGYEEKELIYYANDVLTEYSLENAGTEFETEYEEEVENVADLIGVDTLTSFENSDSDEIYVRNDNLKTDFRIVCSLKEYATKQKKRKKTTPKKEE